MPKNPFYFSPYNLTPQHFKHWGKQGGRPQKYVSPAEKQSIYAEFYLKTKGLSSSSSSA